MEAMRLNAGLPVYEPGHATHMYGPLLTVLLAGIFRVTGLDLLAARIAMSMLTHRARRISRPHLLIARLRRSISGLRRRAVGRPAFSAAADYVQFR